LLDRAWLWWQRHHLFNIAADIIAGALSGRPDIDADLYAFSGKRSSGAR
jgi:hypothetical protein